MSQRLFVLLYSNENADSKRFKTRKYYLPKGIIKNYYVIINEKTLYEEIRKLTTREG